MRSLIGLGKKGRLRVDQPTIAGWASRSSDAYSPLFACIDRTFRSIHRQGLSAFFSLSGAQSSGGDERRHDGRIAVDERNRRWCSDGFEIGCDNGERVRVVFALDCCDREAMSFLATTGGIAGEDVRDLMVAAIEYRFGQAIAFAPARALRTRPPWGGQ
jgi:transposase InsO family protein